MDVFTSLYARVAASIFKLREAIHLLVGKLVSNQKMYYLLLASWLLSLPLFLGAWANTWCNIVFMGGVIFEGFLCVEPIKKITY